MTISMYQASMPVFIRLLGTLRACLQKAEAHAAAKKFDTIVLAQARLAPDMLPLTRQIQIASDTVKGAASRLAGLDAPRYEDTETTFAELYARIDKTIAYAKTFTPAQIDGSEEREIVLKFPNGTLKFTGLDYLRFFALPNFFFHVTTAYDILRHNGVALGKMDFLGGA